MDAILHKDLAIHPKAIVPCPLKRFAFRKAVHCETCGHYRGVVQVAEDPPPREDGTPVRLPWEAKFNILCGHPTRRRVKMLDEE